MSDTDTEAAWLEGLDLRTEQDRHQFWGNGPSGYCNCDGCNAEDDA